MATILIVDDSLTVRTQLKSILSTAGHNVVEAVDGNDGIQKLEAHKNIEVIISDYHMKNTDGFSMLSIARAKFGADRFKIFMLTSVANKDLKEQGKALGILSWIIKPVDGDRLVAAIKLALG